MLDVCICFVSNIHSSFQIQERFVRACGWMCALVALRTDGDGRTIHSAPTTSPASHTLTDAVFMWGRGRRRVSSLHSAVLPCCFFFFSRSRRRGSRAASGDECRLSTTPRPSDCASPTPRGGENTCTGALPRCKGEARLRGLQICGASAWFSCDFFSSFTFSFFFHFFLALCLRFKTLNKDV